MKKTLLIAVSAILVVALAIAGTVAYLTFTAQDKNTFTVGNVEIDQTERERDDNGGLVDFQQDKPLIPSVGEIKWDDEKLNIDGKEYVVFDDELQNVQDKIVTVKNTGNNDTYFRTWFAFENNESASDLIHINYNDDEYRWFGFDGAEWTLVTDANGVEYYICYAVYNETLKVGETSTASLVQLFLDKSADNAFYDAIGEQYDVLVFTEAVQAGGFPDAQTALNEAFGVATEGYNPWTFAKVNP